MYHAGDKPILRIDILQGLTRSLLKLLERYGDYPVILAAGVIGILLLVLPFHNAGRDEFGTMILQVGSVLAVISACLVGKHRLPRHVAAFCIVLVIWILANVAWAISLSPVLNAVLPALSIMLIFWVLLSIGTVNTVSMTILTGIFLGLLYSSYIIWHQMHVPLASPPHWLDPQFRHAIPYRYAGPMDNPNVFAGYVAMILPLSLAATMRSSRWFAILGLATTAVGVAALVLTYSRAGWVAGVLGIVIVIFAGIRYAPRKCGVVILLLLAFFSAFVVFFKPALFQRVQGIVSPTQGTVQHRLFMWQAGFSMLRAHPLTGVGMGCYESAFATYRPKGTMKPFALITAPGSAHNDWVQWCAETGIVGIVLVVIGVLLMISIRIQARREQKVTSDTPLFYWGALGTLVAWAVGGVGQSYLAYPLCALIVCLAFAWLLTDGSVDIRDSGRGITLQYVVLMIALFVVCAGTPIISYARGLRERSECELLANNTQRALEYLHQARIWNPLDVSTLGLGGDTYADLAWASNDSGDQSHLWLANADTWYRQCTNNEPTNGKWHCRLADIQERRGDLHGALISYRRAIKNDWYRASYHLQAGRLAKRLGYPKEARAHLEQAAILFPVWIELSRQRTGPNSIETQTYRNAYNDAKTLLDELISTHRTGAWYVSTGLHFFTSGGEIWHGPVGHKLVALTFDDGPNPLYQSQILATLKRFDAHATFFLVGNMVRKYPQLTRDILADGHELANHSFSHRNMVNLNGDQIIDEVLKARTAIKEVTGKQTYLFRPPGGNVDDFVIRKLRTLDYNTVYWGVNVSEFRNYPLSQQAAMIINKVNDGSIILFHCGPVDRSIDVLAPLLAELTKRGYSCVSVSELMRN